MDRAGQDVFFGSTLRNRRHTLGLTLQQVADHCGCTRAYLSTVETGRPGRPGTEILSRMEEILGYAGGELVRFAYMTSAPPEVFAEFCVPDGPAGRSSGASADRFGVDLDLAYARGELAAGRVPGGPGRRDASSTEPTAGNGRGGTAGADAGGGSDGAGASELGPISVGQAFGGTVRLVGLPSVRVAVINTVSAGYPRWRTDLDYPPGVADEHVNLPGVFDGQAFAARVVGDSMHPRYAEGDLVVFSPAEQVLSGDDCFVRLASGETTFKRVIFADAEGSRLRLVPLNGSYAEREVSGEEVTGLYRAIQRVERIERRGGSLAGEEGVASTSGVGPASADGASTASGAVGAVGSAGGRSVGEAGPRRRTGGTGRADERGGRGSKGQPGRKAAAGRGVAGSSEAGDGSGAVPGVRRLGEGHDEWID